MCGRYRLARSKQLLAEYFETNFDDLEWEPRYNLAPTQPVLLVRREREGARPKPSLMCWGLVPSWAADRSAAARMINARAETAASKPSFREALVSRRCLIPADGFYEWVRSRKNAKQPYCFEVGEGSLFAFAGLWDRWLGPDGKLLETCAILTTTANELLAGVHDRMPVIVARENYDGWLDPRMRDAERAGAMLGPFDAKLMRRYAVSTQVNQVANDGPECSTPVELAPEPATLFDLLG